MFQLADHVTVMNEGRVLLDGSVEEARVQQEGAGSLYRVGYDGCGGEAARDRGEGEPLLTVKNVDTFYGKSHILNDVNFTLHENEIIALLGAQWRG